MDLRMGAVHRERREVQGYLILCDLIPGFREDIKEKARLSEDFEEICDTV